MDAAIYTINPTDPDQLAAVMADMEALGAPTIRACWQGDHWCALEGSHRVAAARLLGLPVVILEMDEDDDFGDHDIQDLPETCTVRDVLLYADWTHGGHIQETE